MGQVSDTDADKVYDYHTAFYIKPTEVLFNVNINANQKIYGTLLWTETVIIVQQQ